MKRIFIVLFLIEIFTLNTCLSSEQKSQPFENIVLTTNLPEIFEVGETYYIHGKISNYKKNSNVSVSLNYINGNYIQNRRYNCTDSTFSVGITFEYVGNYYLDISVNYQSRGSIIIRAINPITITPLPILPINQTSIVENNSLYKIRWISENELIHIQFSQMNVAHEYILSNSPKEFIIIESKLSAYKPGKIKIKIRGSRSLNGSKFTQCSKWTDWHILEPTLIEKLWSKKKSTVKFQTPYKNTGHVNSQVTMNLNIAEHYEPFAYVKRPDGYVDRIPIISIKKTKKFSISDEIREMKQPGNCLLKYRPQVSGTYIFEINDVYGNAILNTPYYCDNGFPLLPEHIRPWESDSSKYNINLAKLEMLQKINHLRNSLQLDTLYLDSTLTQMSQYYANRMASESFTGHYAPDGEGLLQRKQKFNIITTISENVAKANSIGASYRNLLRSPAHYASIIDTSITRIGLGICQDINGEFYVTQHFAPEVLTQQNIDTFISYIFQKMVNEKKRLKQIYQPSEWPCITSTSYKGPDLVTLENLIFSEANRHPWKLKSVGEVLFQKCEQTVEGIILTIKYYPIINKGK